MPVGRGAKQRLATETNHMVWDYLILTASYPLVFTSHSLVISMQFDHYLHTPYRKLQHRFIDLRSIHTSILSDGNARFPYNRKTPHEYLLIMLLSSIELMTARSSEISISSGLEEKSRTLLPRRIKRKKRNRVGSPTSNRDMSMSTSHHTSPNLELASKNVVRVT